MHALAMTRGKSLPYAFAAIWLLANAVLAGLIAAGQASFQENGTWIALLVIIPCDAALLAWIRNPIRQDRATRKTSGGKLLGLIALVVIVFVLLLSLLGRFLLLALAGVAALIVIFQKGYLNKREWAYAAFLALIAALAGLGREDVTFITPVQWGILQVPLTLFCFLAGWSTLRRAGLLQQGVGRSRLIAEGPLPALRSFLLGILLGTPWALAMLVMGSAEGSRATWVQAWWQPLVALNPGIAEEAWGRFLWVPLAFLLFRRAGSDRTAFSVALIVMAYLFAAIHIFGSRDVVENLLSTFIMGLFTLPVSVVCLFRDLETAIGFHFWMDFLKYAFALVLFAG
jgi:hypothetical protein